MNKRAKYYPLNFMGGLTLLFIYLKLTGQIDWSWWLVLLPHLLNVAVRTMDMLIEDWARESHWHPPYGGIK